MPKVVEIDNKKYLRRIYENSINLFSHSDKHYNLVHFVLIKGY